MPSAFGRFMRVILATGAGLGGFRQTFTFSKKGTSANFFTVRTPLTPDPFWSGVT